MEIRQIQPEDAEKFVEFYKQLADESDYLPFTPEEVADKADKEEEYIKKYNHYKQVFIALDDDEIVGYLGIARSHLSRLTHTAKFTVGVLDSHKRQGIATKLIEFAEDWAKQQKVKRLELTVIEDNDAAIALFEKNGYNKEGSREKAIMIDNEPVDEIFMAKIIE